MERPSSPFSAPHTYQSLLFQSALDVGFPGYTTVVLTPGILALLVPFAKSSCSQTKVTSESPGALVELQKTGSHPHVSDSVGLGLRIFISNKLPGDTDAAGPGITPEDPPS